MIDRYGWQSALVIPGIVGVVFTVISWVMLKPIDPPQSEKVSTWSGVVSSLVSHVLVNPDMWLMSVSCFFIIVVRTSMTVWLGALLRENLVSACVRSRC